MDTYDSITRTKIEFETSFMESSYYDKQTQDESHLTKILENLFINDGDTVLDLGTGSGYLAFPLALTNPYSKIIGLDIVTRTLEVNRKKAEERNIDNLKFIDYNGMTLPFADSTFNVIVTRYALHHFPDIKAAFREISRVLKPGGQLFVSDPTPNPNDKKGFADAFMQLKPDGHIKFYTEDEFLVLAGEVSLEWESSFMTEIRFPRKTDGNYDALLRRSDKEVVNGYDIQVIADEIYIKEQVLNLSFIKR